jgi:restriction endonuclease S subunit
MSTSSTSQAARTEFYERLHNLLWNDAGLDPHDALEHLTFFFSYYLMEPQIDRMGLPIECKWSYLIFILGQENPEYHLITAIRTGIENFRKNPITKPFFSIIELIRPGDKRPVIVRKLVEEINVFNASTHDTDTLGDVFEYIYGRGATTISDAGQYFTPRSICKAAFDLAYSVKRTIRHPDGKLYTFADFFCGTGGFASSFVKGVKKIEPWNDWSRDHLEVYCLDKSLRAVKTTLLNLLILTGQPFSERQIREHNSFQDNIVIGDQAPFKDKTFDLIFSNPPFGGDKRGDYGFKHSRANPITREREYFVNDEIRSVGIDENSKSCAGLQLAMATLSSGGVCCMVLPQGFFFGSERKIVALRKKLIEEFRLHYVLEIDAGSFTNTMTKTSMVVFQRGVAPSEVIQFLKLDPSTGDGISTIVMATSKQLSEKSFSLDYRRYMNRNEKPPPGFRMMKLGDLLEQGRSGRTQVGEISNTGEYPFYSCKAKAPSGTHNSFDFDGEEYLLLARGGGNSKTMVSDRLGIGKFHLVRGKCAATTDVVRFTLKNNEVNLLYLHHLLQVKLPDIQRTARYTTTLGKIDIPQVLDWEVPVPAPEYQHIATVVDSLYQMIQTEKKMITHLETVIAVQIKIMGYDAPLVKMRDVVKLQTGVTITRNESESGEYPVYGGGDSCFSISEFNQEGKFVIAKCGVSEKCVRYVHGKFFLNQHGWTFSVKGENNYFYIGHWLLSNQSRVIDMASGTSQQTISQEVFYDMEFHLPLLNKQNTLQLHFDDILSRYSKIAEYQTMSKTLLQRYLPGSASEEITQDDGVNTEPDTGGSSSASQLTPPSTPPPTPPLDKSNTLFKMTVKQLIELCRVRGIKCYSGKKKEQLISMLQE